MYEIVYYIRIGFFPAQCAMYKLQTLVGTPGRFGGHAGSLSDVEMKAWTSLTLSISSR